MLKQELLDLLCCPKCKGDLAYAPEKETLTCKQCGAVYPVRDGIPIMLPEEQQG
ncbi:MAG TPA: Trm112 family protein [Bacteroidota bacterium]